jgi:hypothetical protein
MTRTPGRPTAGVGPRSDDGLARRDVLKSTGVLPPGTAVDADGTGTSISETPVRSVVRRPVVARGGVTRWQVSLRSVTRW